MQSWIEGETQPRVYTLYESEGELQDLTGATVVLLLTGADGTEIDTTGAVAIDADPTTGRVTYTPTTAHLLASLSPLAALFQVTDAGGAVGYYPSDGADEWHVYPTRTAAPRLTFLDLRTQVLRWLDAAEDLNTGSSLDLLVMQQLNEAAFQRASEYPWPFMKASYRLPVTGSSSRYSLPGNLGRLLYLWSPTAGRFCERIPDRHLQDFGLRPDGLDNGTGLFMPFELQGSMLVFHQPPAYGETLYLQFFKSPAKMVNDSDIPNVPFPHSRLLVWDAVMDLKAYAQELSIIPLAERKQAAALHALYAAYVEGQTLGERANSIHVRYGD